ncbi:MAG: radical SAM protein [Thermodesulfobacteriota bacterium]|nr:radical SAM protein [Thermodesulfobacteriota bacterium]
MKPFRLFLANVGKRQVEFPLVTPPMGIMSLAAYIRSRYNADIRLLNQKVPNCPNSRVVAMAREFKADVVGLSATSPTAHNLPEITHGIKAAMPGTLIVLGGAHVSSVGGDAMANTEADAAVAGEGEIALEQILRARFEGDTLADVPGIFRRTQDGRIVQNPGRIPFIKDIDTLPPPAYDLIDLPPYWKLQSMPPLPRRRYASLFSSRGCPYKCIYCHRIFGSKFRYHSAERIADEMQYLQKTYGVNDIEFLDDIFNLNKKRIFALSEHMQARNIHTKLAFPNGVRTDIFTKEELKTLVDMGMYFASFALESGSPRIQQLIGKKLNIDRFLENVRYAVSLGVFANGFAMMGFPTETETDLQRTIDVACQSRLHTISFFTTTPFPNTPMHTMAQQKYPERVSAIPFDDMEYAGLTVNLSDVPDHVLFAYQRKANRRFFLKPGRMARLIRDFPKPHLLPLYLPVFIRRASKGLVRH